MAPSDTSHLLERSGSETANHHPPSSPQGRYLALLSLAALGVVYGDIGTSPLYAIRESFLPEHGVGAAPANVLGVLSLIFWSLIVVISVKYLVFILRADNRGEGGILALTSLVTPVGALRGGRWGLILLGLFATALLYGDGMITPAISVLSAVEGLGVVNHDLEPYVLEITIAILVGLFAIQRHGTAGVGKVFGPVTLVWFLVLSWLGIEQLVQNPEVLAAVSPLYAIQFFADNGWHAFLVVGSVFLVVTGGEALYADMGHFGRKPIRLAWFVLVLPALLLNYFGQGALILRDPTMAENPFFRMAPDWARLPVVLIATAATIIASQALISGSYSLTMQAVQLGYSPRVDIRHTSAKEIGQIYIPGINWTLMVACIGLVLGFKSSSAMAAAYGVAVTTTMVVTSILFCVVALESWKWRLPVVVAVGGLFLGIDLVFWGANLLKIPHGGWFPLVIGVVVFTLLTTWKRGRQILQARMRDRSQPRATFLMQVAAHPPIRAPGTAIFMSGNPESTPLALLHNLEHNKVLHERVILLSVETDEVPAVPAEQRTAVKDLGQGVYQVSLHYGFMEEVDVPQALRDLRHAALSVDPETATFFLGRETLLATQHPGMAIWREKLFALMSRNATNAVSFFRLPPGRVVEFGVQIEL